MSLFFGEGQDAQEIEVDIGFFASTTPADAVCLDQFEIEFEDLHVPEGDGTEVPLEAIRISGEEVVVSNEVTVHQEEPLTPIILVLPTTSTTELPSSVAPITPVVSHANNNDKLSAYRHMTLPEFQREMDQSIGEVVNESLVLFDKDPREYHPFYLRIFKYLTIGQQLGWIVKDNEGEIWRKYDHFAKTQVELAQERTLPLLGERSAYATYILTKKVVINGQVVKGDKKHFMDKPEEYRRLEGIVNKMRKERNGGGEGIKEDLDTRLQFFRECQKMTYPTEVIKMNNLWSKLLDEKGLKKEVLTNPQSTSPHHPPQSEVKTPSSPIHAKRLQRGMVRKWRKLKGNQAQLKRPLVLKRKLIKKITKKKESNVHAKLEQILVKKISLKRKGLSVKTKDKAAIVTKKRKSSIPSDKDTAKCTVQKVSLPKEVPVPPPKLEVPPETKPDLHTFTCPVLNCPKSLLKDARSLWIHYAGQHINLEQLCPEVSKLKSQDSSTPNSGPGGSGGPCEHCGKIYRPNNVLLRHINTVHGPGLLKENYRKCSYCQKAFKTKCAMNAHIRRLHTLEEIIRCDICGKGCATSGKLWKHRVEDHGLSPEEEANKLGVQFEPCQFCGEVMQKGRAIRYHIEREHPKDYPDWWELEKVRRREHEREVEQRRKELLKKVKMEETIPIKKEVDEDKEASKRNREQKFICPKEKCGQTLSDRWNVLVHLMQVHCDFEERLVKEKLVRFLGKTGNYSKYLCNLCNSQLYDRGEVRVHIIANHPDIYQSIVKNAPFPEKERSCSICQERFIEKGKLKEHLEQSHADDCWRCPECWKVVISPEDLTDHFVEEHGNGQNISVEFISGTRQRAKTSNLMDKTENDKKRKETYLKYATMRIDCPICRVEQALCSMTDHLKRMHNLEEDGVLWRCPVCCKDNFKKRQSWLGHMEHRHPGMVVMEDMLEVAKQINSLVDWRTMEVPTVERRGVGYSKRKDWPKGCRNRKGDKFPKRKLEVRKKQPEGSQRKVRKKVRFNLDNLPTSKSVKGSRRGRKKNLENWVEKQKKLVISLRRLTSKEILKWRRV